MVRLSSLSSPLTNPSSPFESFCFPCSQLSHMHKTGLPQLPHFPSTRRFSFASALKKLIIGERSREPTVPSFTSLARCSMTHLQKELQRP